MCADDIGCLALDEIAHDRPAFRPGVRRLVAGEAEVKGHHAQRERRVVGAEGAAAVDGGGVALGADDVHEALEAPPDAGGRLLPVLGVRVGWRGGGLVARRLVIVCWNGLALWGGVLRAFQFGRARVRVDGEAAVELRSAWLEVGVTRS